MRLMDRRTTIATASRDGYLALRRVERQQAVIERLHAMQGERVPLADLARGLGVSVRTTARDVERLRLSGLPLEIHRGRTGGVSLPVRTAVSPVALDVPEIAALVSSLAVLGPTVSPSAGSAMRKLVDALLPDAEGG